MLDEVTTDMRIEWPGRRLRLRGGLGEESSFRPTQQYGRGD